MLLLLARFYLWYMQDSAGFPPHPFYDVLFADTSDLLVMFDMYACMDKD